MGYSTDDSYYDEVLKINFIGTIAFTKEVLPHMP